MPGYYCYAATTVFLPLHAWKLQRIDGKRLEIVYRRGSRTLRTHCGVTFTGSIVGSNLEFFMVRVAGLAPQLDAGTLEMGPDRVTLRVQLVSIRREVTNHRLEGGGSR